MKQSTARAICKRTVHVHGFTLVELLVSMTVLSLIMIGLYGSLKLGVDAWEKNTAQTTQTDEIRLTQSFLRDLLKTAYPLYITTDLTEAHVAFDGTLDEIAFLSSALGASTLSGRMHYQLSRRQTGRGLQLEISARHELSHDKEEDYQEVVMGGFQTLEFSYFGSSSKGLAPRWHQNWKNMQELPQLVRIQGTFKNKQLLSWPDLTIAPVISVDANCVFDPSTHYCRGR